MTQHFTACVPHEGRERRVVVGTVTSMPSNVTWKTNKLCSDSCFKSALCCGVFFGQTFFGFPLQISFVLWGFFWFVFGGDRSFLDWISTHRHPHPPPTFFSFFFFRSQPIWPFFRTTALPCPWHRSQGHTADHLLKEKKQLAGIFWKQLAGHNIYLLVSFHCLQFLRSMWS